MVPIVAAGALAHLEGHSIHGLHMALMLAAAICIQIATNLFNDAIDFKKGADKNRRGPTRVTQSGLISEKTVFIWACGFCALAFLSGIPLVLHGGWPLIAIGLSSLFLAYGYTGGPFPLAYRGLGDLFVILFFGLIAVAGAYYVFTLTWTLSAFLLGLQIGFLATVLIAINNLRDSDFDAKVGKRTLAVRWGDGFVVGEIIFLIVASYILMGYWVWMYRNPWFALFFMTVPLAVKIVQRVRGSQDKARLLPALGQSALLHILFGVSFSVSSLL